MNDHYDRRAARRQDLALLFTDACAAGYRPAPPHTFAGADYLPAHAVPGPGSRPLAKDFAPPPAA